MLIGNITVAAVLRFGDERGMFNTLIDDELVTDKIIVNLLKVNKSFTQQTRAEILQGHAAR